MNSIALVLNRPARPPWHHFAHVLHARTDRTERMEGRLRRSGDEPGQRGLPTPGGPQHHAGKLNARGQAFRRMPSAPPGVPGQRPRPAHVDASVRPAGAIHPAKVGGWPSFVSASGTAGIASRNCSAPVAGMETPDRSRWLSPAAPRVRGRKITTSCRPIGPGLADGAVQHRSSVSGSMMMGAGCARMAHPATAQFSMILPVSSCWSKISR